MRSLQRRVIVGGLLWAIVATVVGTVALLSVFDQITDRRFREALQEQHTQAIVALGNTEAPELVEQFLTNPSYARVYSGRYWQIFNDEGVIHTSPSLFDAEFPTQPPTDVGVEFWDGEGPSGPVRGIKEQIVLGDGSAWTVMVAASISTLTIERAEMRRSVGAAFGFVGALGIAAAALLTSVLLAPLQKLSGDVARRWDSGNALVPSDYPAEVAPLVADINELISRNRDILDRGRRQAADLAHALKTPSAALRNELIAISRKTDGTAPLFEALDRIDSQIVRSLARMRAESAEQAVNLKTDVATAVERMERLFKTLCRAENKSLSVRSQPATASVDAQDLEEMLGNVLENALKWCKTRIHLSVEVSKDFVLISIEDDGPGIAPEKRQEVLKEGIRLDSAVPGTGLGLSIAKDLIAAYKGSLDLRDSPDLGGLKVIISLPTTPMKLDRRNAKTA